MKLFLLLMFTSVSLLGQTLMPLPKSIVQSGDRINVQGVEAVFGDLPNELVDRFSDRLYKVNSQTLSNYSDYKLILLCDSITSQNINTDESYSLIIDSSKAVLSSVNQIGLIRGFETFIQLVDTVGGSFSLPVATIYDSPRFKWRGLLIDVCRHFMPLEVLKRNIDAMCVAKLNVLHLHLTEDQGFRIESKKYPKLHQKGSNGDYYTQEQMRELLSYAKVRGVRIVPEFDIPGHASSWLTAYPKLASAPGPYEIEQKFGVFDPTFDPTNEKTYKFFRGFLTEMSELFPDEYIHIGGDENKGKQWDANPNIQSFMKSNGFMNNHELQAYFNSRILSILTDLDKKMMGWDEIFEAEIPKNIMIQSWRGKESLCDVAKAGYPGVLSNGYYLDKVYDTQDYYMNDPLPKGHDLTKEQEGLILGGEATMWSELVSEETIDSRIWPSSLAFAERMWSPRDSTQNINGMYERLWKVSSSLEQFGLDHLSIQQEMLAKYWSDTLGVPKELIPYLEPSKGYERHYVLKRDSTYSVDYSLTQIADMCYTESRDMKDYLKLYEKALEDDAYIQQFNELNNCITSSYQLEEWSSTYQHKVIHNLILLNELMLEKLKTGELKVESKQLLKKVKLENSQIQIGQIDRWIELLSK